MSQMRRLSSSIGAEWKKRWISSGVLASVPGVHLYS